MKKQKKRRDSLLPNLVQRSRTLPKPSGKNPFWVMPGGSVNNPNPERGAAMKIPARAEVKEHSGIRLQAAEHATLLFRRFQRANEPLSEDVVAREALRGVVFYSVVWQSKRDAYTEAFYEAIKALRKGDGEDAKG